MKISVITISLNSSQLIEKAIKSVISQGYHDIEYWIIDGGSTDGTIDIIKRFASIDHRIKWISEPDMNGADAYNKGITRSTGDLIGILNSDDEYCEGAIEAVADAFIMHPDFDIFHGDIIMHEGETPLYRLKPSDVDANIWHEVPINATAAFITRRAYKKVGVYDIELKAANDYDMYLRLYRNNFRFYYIEKVIVKMRYGGFSDKNALKGLKAVSDISARQGYPRHKALIWLAYKVGISSIKNILRRLRLFSLMRIHPRFRSYKYDQ